MPLRIVLVAPPWYTVPPQGYGGVELVVALLAEGLRARGHTVTLIAADGSGLEAVACAPAGLSADLGSATERHREVTYAARALDVLGSLGPVDVIHDHCGFSTLVGAAGLGIAPVIHTVHGSLSEPELTMYGALSSRVGLVAISHTQRRSAAGLPWLATVLNAVDIRALAMGSAAEKEPYLVCLARICPNKGQHLAIEVARRTGMRLVLAGKVEATHEGRAYFERLVLPALDGDRIIHLHNVAGVAKARLLGRATALLAPLQWEEPFGLSLVEAIVCGTPAIALRRGSAPELIVEGVTGLLADDVDGLVDAVRRSASIDPARCAEVGRARFSPAAMATGYLDVYNIALGEVLAGVPWHERVPAFARLAVAPASASAMS